MSVASSSSFPCIKIQNPSSSSSSYNFRFSTTLTIRSSQADGPLRRPMVQPPTPLKPTPPSPPSSSSPPPPSKQVAVEGKNVITMEFQRQKAKELQEYFKQKKLETGTGDENQPKFPQSEPQIPSVSSSSSDPQAPEMDPQKWGTHIMGPPAVPTCHPDNQKAASWRAEDQREEFQPQPYVVYSPIDKPSNNPLDSVVNVFNSWSNRAENIARNIWYNLKAGPSVTEAAWGKLNLTAKALTEGGFEPLYKQIFGADPNEQLKKTFACYLSTATGPVAGTLYLSTTKVAFCSDRPLSFKAPSGQEAWSYYKVAIPLGNIGTINQ